MELLSIERIWRIDPHEPYKESDGEEIIVRHNNTEIEIAKKRLSRFLDRVEFIEATSCRAVDRGPDSILDFCYIDGNHSYEYVKEDIRNYLPNVKARRCSWRSWFPWKPEGSL
ncbi:MAG: class I SAM-dependent methyltransferase [Candidatus Thorarchaeota archaeon]|nr:MAG: class I SAM-dependent methyltransferase [Candidatus Thorarchaeota archaeon]